MLRIADEPGEFLGVSAAISGEPYHLRRTVSIHGPKGKVVERFAPLVTPAQLEKEIEKELAK